MGTAIEIREIAPLPKIGCWAWTEGILPLHDGLYALVRE
jgi:hypothetical protein